MLIHLLRHGRAEAVAKTDRDRKLTQQGILQNEAVIQQFKLRSPEVDRVLTSPYPRAQETAAALNGLFPNLIPEDCKQLLPDTDVYTLMDFMEKSNVQNLMLIGHNPMLSNLLSVLVGGTLGSRRQLGTSTLVCVTMESMAPGSGEISYILQP